MKNKKIIFKKKKKNCAPFIKCTSEINNTEIDNANDIDIVKPMYNLIEYSEVFKSIWRFMAILQR